MTTGYDRLRPLAQLERSGLVELVETDPDLEYLFRHALIQEAAYASLLRPERRRLHLGVARAMEHVYADRLEELAPVIAMHLEEGGDAPRAVEYLVRAGHFALERSALHEAKAAFDRAAALTDPDSQDGDVRRRRVEIAVGRVESGSSFTPADEMLEVLEAARTDAELLGDDKLLARVYLLIARERILRGEQYGSSEPLREAAERGLALAEATRDAMLRAEPLAVLGEARFGAAEYGAAVELLEEAVPLFEAAGRLDKASLSAGTLAIAHARLGAFAAGLRWVERATDLGRQSGDPTAILDADLAHALLEAARGNAAAAIEHADRAAAEADRIDNKACAIVARSIIGEQRLLLGQPEQAIRVLEEGAGLAEYCDLSPTRIEFTRALLDAARARAGGDMSVTDRLDLAIELARTTGDRLGEAEAMRQRARERARCGWAAEGVAEDFRSAAAIFRRLDARPDLLLTLQEHAATEAAGGRVDEAVRLRGEAEEIRRALDVRA
jgi:hypothetical protein